MTEAKPTYWGAKNKSPRQKASRNKRARLKKKELMFARAEKFNRWWPGLFDRVDTKPLKLGIDAELLADAQQRGLSLSVEQLDKFLTAWTRYHRYLKAIVKGEYRYGLNGELVALTEADKEAAAAWLAEAKECRRTAREKADKARIYALLDRHANSLERLADR